MQMNKDEIIREIQRSARVNGGKVLGWKRFETETGIRYHDWYGRHWTRWGDAVQEAGLEPNQMSKAYSDEFLLEKLALLTRRLGRVPVVGDLLLESKRDEAFPSEKVFRRFGSKAQRVFRVIEHCEANSGNEDVSALWKGVVLAKRSLEPEEFVREGVAIGYVYLLQHGSRREYKIGRTYNPVRREGEVRIELPEKLEPLHYIKTDDPVGIEKYWHSRFAIKRKEGEWFELTAADIAAFKKWKRIF